MLRKFIVSGVIYIGLFGAVCTWASPIPVSTWADRDIISAQLSRDGTYIGLLRAYTESDDAPRVEIFRVEDMELVARQMANPMRIQQFFWINDSKFVMFLSQQIRSQIEGFNRGVFGAKVVVVDVTKETDRESAFSVEATPQVRHMLPEEPDKLIVAIRDDRRRPRGIFELDLSSGKKRLIIREQIAIGNIRIDEEGNPFAAFGFDRSSDDQVYLYRPEGSKEWIEYYRSSVDDFELFSLLEKDPELENHFLVYANNGHDKIGLWSFDLTSKKFGELIYRREDVDILGSIYHSNAWREPDTVVGIRSFKGEYINEFWDETEGAIYDQLKSVIPDAGLLTYSRSYDGNTFLILNRSPVVPPTYYLLHQGKISVLGSTYPRVATSDLGEREFITWEARDGRTIPGLLTVPPTGEKPYPLIVMPHGGPYVTEASSFDPWAALLANHGYAVLQPQYRGSRNFGLEHYLSAFQPKSEAGYAMQDDKDDGALYLADNDIVDPNRMAMFGWSYGGYAAFVASMRQPQIYQCAIAAAAVSDPVMQVNYYRYNVRGTQKEEQLTTWLGAFSPFKNLGRVNIPLFLIHGNLDQRVPLSHAKKVLSGLTDAEINYKYMEIEGIDHFSNTLYYSHRNQLWTSILDYLENDCGPEGL